MVALALLALCALTAATPAPRAVAPEIDGGVSFSLTNQQIWPPNIPGQTFPQNLKVFCADCTLTGAISVSADSGSDTPDSNFTAISTGFDFTSSWIGLAVDQFELHIELVIQLEPLNSSTTPLDIHLLAAPLVLAEDVGLAGASVTFDPHIIGTVNVSSTVNFTWGFDITVPPGSVILIPFTSPSDFVIAGFNQTSITAIPFQSSTENLEMTFELAVRHQFGANLTVADISVSGDVFFDIPALSVEVDQVTSVDASCNPYQSGASSQEFGQLTKVSPQLSLNAGFEIGDDKVHEINTTEPLAASCYQYDTHSQQLVTPGTAPNAAGKQLVPLFTIFVALLVGTTMA